MIYRWARRTGRWAAVCALLLSPVQTRADTITVFAAASLKTALDDIAAGFTSQTGHDLRLSLAGSSALARQIQLGAPADVFISANPEWMDVLHANGLLTSGSRIDLVGNRLVVIAPADSAMPLDLAQPDAIAVRLDTGPLAMALVNAVPAGIYGKEALETLGHWTAISHRVAQTDNVRAALALVSAGEAPLGLVYASDVSADPDVVVVADIPETAHAPIIYPAAVIKGGNEATSIDFLSYLQTTEARSVFAAQGFQPLEP